MAIVLLSCYSCNNFSTNVGLNIESYNFNRVDDTGEFALVPNDEFDLGEQVYMMFFNVSGFNTDESGKCWLEMDMEITDTKDGKLIFEKKELLGENGHVELSKGTAPNPQTSFTPPPDLPAGEYSFYVKIYDKVGNGHASVSKTFSYK